MFWVVSEKTEPYIKVYLRRNNYTALKFFWNDLSGIFHLYKSAEQLWIHFLCCSSTWYCKRVIVYSVRQNGLSERLYIHHYLYVQLEGVANISKYVGC